MPSRPIVASIGKKNSQTIPSGRWTPLDNFDTVWSDHHAMKRPGGLVVPVGGWYLAAAHIVWAPAPGGQRAQRFWRDTANTHTGTEDDDSSAGRDYDNNMWPFYIPKGKLARVEVWQSSGRPLAVEFAEFKLIYQPAIPVPG